eukprot:TRINITY_DN3029_c0_g1_i3.p1 TRINITY_DN3029_c0_g1~~TRINITY_DN3029_c0_g1_i3.p1  ORF type:complete len:158 (+),score=18.81 TRINITY_DN3029_c0_g1_i3:22-474(+)
MEDEPTPTVPLPVEEEGSNEQAYIHATRTMFQALNKYLRGELNCALVCVRKMFLALRTLCAVTLEDYLLLERMNRVATQKYNEMADYAEGLGTFIAIMQAKYDSLRPYLDQIDEIDARVTQLEQVVNLLNDYTKRLEQRFKSLQYTCKAS